MDHVRVGVSQIGELYIIVYIYGLIFCSSHTLTLMCTLVNLDPGRHQQKHIYIYIYICILPSSKPYTVWCPPKVADSTPVPPSLGQVGANGSEQQATVMVVHGFFPANDQEDK